MGLFDSILNNYHIPTTCSECGGILVFEGVGTYHCEKCGNIQYDDYGKVRNYIEKHPGATTSETEASTGVASKTILRMLKEERIEVTQDSKMMLHCERCRTPIRSGRFCPKCEVEVHRLLEDEERRKRAHDMKGVLIQNGNEDSGQRRFMGEH